MFKVEANYKHLITLDYIEPCYKTWQIQAPAGLQKLRLCLTIAALSTIRCWLHSKFTDWQLEQTLLRDSLSKKVLHTQQCCEAGSTGGTGTNDPHRCSYNNCAPLLSMTVRSASSLETTWDLASRWLKVYSSVWKALVLGHGFVIQASSLIMNMAHFPDLFCSSSQAENRLLNLSSVLLRYCYCPFWDGTGLAA